MQKTMQRAGKSKAAARKATFSRYDSADYLKSDADTAAYLEAIAEDGDPALVTHALGVVARARNMAALARDAGITRQGLYKALSGAGDPSFGNVMKIAHALGFQLAFQPMEKGQVEIQARPKGKPAPKKSVTLSTLANKKSPAGRRRRAGAH